MENYILRNILSADNELRRQAENQLLSDRETNPAALLQILTEGMKDADFSVAQLSAITYKKLFLDDPRSEQLTVQDLELPKSYWTMDIIKILGMKRIACNDTLVGENAVH